MLHKLDYPNEEVRLSFKIYLLAAFSQTNIQSVENSLSKLRKALEENRGEESCQIMQSLFAHIPYHLHIGQERYYHSLFQLVATLLSLESHAEEATDKGRVDLVIKTSSYIYLFELKIDSTPATAIEQIMNKRYYEKYLLDGRKLIVAGLCFNSSNEKLTLACNFKELERL